MISFDLLKDLDNGYNRVKNLLRAGKLDEAKSLFKATKALETDIVDLLEEMLMYDEGKDELMSLRINSHLENMKYFTRKSELISASLLDIAR